MAGGCLGDDIRCLVRGRLALGLTVLLPAPAWRAADIMGQAAKSALQAFHHEAAGKTAGNAMNFVYDLDLPIQGSVWRVRFDDWMLQQDAEVMVNKSTITKFGIELGEVFIFFRRVSDAPQ